VRAVAEALPFRDATFDSGLAILTIHHWTEKKRGLGELGRTTKNTVVIFTFDPSSSYFWLTDYFPELPTLDQQCMPPIGAIKNHFGNAKVLDLPIPFDCRDGFLAAYWRRPHAYLDPNVRAAISSFAMIKNTEAGLRSLEQDLASGDWHKRYGKVLQQTELDVGYRLVLAQLH